MIFILQKTTKNGRTSLWYAASEGHNNVLYYLLREKHDSYELLEDRRVSEELRESIPTIIMFTLHVVNVLCTQSTIACQTLCESYFIFHNIMGFNLSHCV